jgi:hypothetical protein
MDTYPVDTPTTRGGDGVLNTLDLIVLLQRITNIDTTRPTRTPLTTCSATQAQTAARRSLAAPGPAAGKLELVPAGVASDGSQRTAIFLQATVDLDLAGLSFSITSGSNNPLRFIASDQPPSMTDTGVAGRLALAWLNGWSARAGQRVLLGYVETSSGSSLAIQAVSGNAASDGSEVILEFTSSRQPLP